jgi:hypothetical protein
VALGTGFPLCCLESQGYGGGILTLPQSIGPGPCIYIPQEQDGVIKSKMSKSRYVGWSVNQYVLVPSPSFRGAPSGRSFNLSSGGVH